MAHENKNNENSVSLCLRSSSNYAKSFEDLMKQDFNLTKTEKTTLFVKNVKM